jgi:hypothetical protein
MLANTPLASAMNSSPDTRGTSCVAQIRIQRPPAIESRGWNGKVRLD